jgi:hypothetical protein
LQNKANSLKSSTSFEILFQIKRIIFTMSIDLVRTINDGDDVPDFSENSDSEDEAQPTKKRNVNELNKDFDAGFKFVNTQKEYLQDTWVDDVQRYIKKKAKTTTDDKGGLISRVLLKIWVGSG